ncbi:type II toxin-antitoxin system HicB family antitoxin [Candidatus Woesearchaeota archaeon]|nr:type II toxin-antitoxin system HicB family antitoxin [Candidatus Woesearchaeota archaeon]
MTNINISIPDDLHKELKVAAAMEDKPLKELVIERLRKYGSKRGGKV